MRKSNIVDEAINQYLNTGDVSVLQNNLGPFDGELACEDDELAYCIKRSDLQGAIARIKKITNFSEDNKMKDINDEFLDGDKYLVNSDRDDIVDDDNYVVKDFSELDNMETDSSTDDKLDKIIKILELTQDDDNGDDLDIPESDTDTEITVTEDFGDDLGESDEEDEYEDDGVDLASEEGLEDEDDSEESDFEIDDDDTQEFSEKNFGFVDDLKDKVKDGIDKIEGRTPETKDNKAFVNHGEVWVKIRPIVKDFIDEVNLLYKSSHYVDKEEYLKKEDKEKIKLGYEKCLKDTWAKIKNEVNNFSSVNVVKIFSNANLNFSNKMYLFDTNKKLDKEAEKEMYEALDKFGRIAYVKPANEDLRAKCINEIMSKFKEQLMHNYSYIKKGIKKLSTNFAGSESFKSAAELDLDEVAEQKKQDEKANYLKKQLDNTEKHKKLVGGSPIAKQDQDKYKKELSEIKSSKEKDKAYLEDKEKIASDEVKREKEDNSNSDSSKKTETTVNASVNRLLNYSLKHLEVINYGNFRKGI